MSFSPRVSSYLVCFFAVRLTPVARPSTILVDRARDEKPFVMTNLSKATLPFAVQGPRLPWLWCSTPGHLLLACRTDRQQSGAIE
jgi:hypothetical protein